MGNDATRRPIRRRTIRPYDDDWAAAQKVLKAHGWQMTEFLNTCLAAVAGSTDGMLKSLGRFRTKPPRGRPKRPTD